MKTLVVLALVTVLVQAALAIECTPNFCDMVRCARVDPNSCDGEVRPNASFCGCCEQCISIIKSGNRCFGGFLGIPPTSECETGTACVNNLCTPISDITQQ